MSKFEVGDIVIGIDNPYTFTCLGWRGRVTAVNGNLFSATAIESSYPGTYHNLEMSYFKLLSPVVYPEQLKSCTYCNLDLITFDDEILYSECSSCKSLYAKNGDVIAGNNIVQPRDIEEDTFDIDMEVGYDEDDDDDDEELDYREGCTCQYCRAWREANVI